MKDTIVKETEKTLPREKDDKKNMAQRDINIGRMVYTWFYEGES